MLQEEVPLLAKSLAMTREVVHNTEPVSGEPLAVGELPEGFEDSGWEDGQPMPEGFPQDWDGEQSGEAAAWADKAGANRV